MQRHAPTQLVLIGDPYNEAGGGLKINGCRFLSLTQRQYLVVFVLALYSKMLANTTGDLAPFARMLVEPDRIPPTTPSSPFLSAKSVINAIQRILKRHKPRPTAFPEPDAGPGQIMKVMSELRGKVEKLGANEEIIARGDSGHGYSLNIEPRHLVIIVPGVGGQQREGMPSGGALGGRPVGWRGAAGERPGW